MEIARFVLLCIGAFWYVFAQTEGERRVGLSITLFVAAWALVRIAHDMYAIRLLVEGL